MTIKIALILAMLAGLSACGTKNERPDWTQSVDLMIWKLADSDYTVRRCAARALGRLGPRAEKAVPALLCAEGDEDPSVREAVTFALHRILPETAMLMARSDQ